MRKETDQLAARELLQEGHEHVSILDVLEQVFHLDGRRTLRHRRQRRVRTSQPLDTEPTQAQGEDAHSTGQPHPSPDDFGVRTMSLNPPPRPDLRHSCIPQCTERWRQRWWR